jgi:hypothetical protein
VNGAPSYHRDTRDFLKSGLTAIACAVTISGCGAGACAAQTALAPGTVEVSGISGFGANRQTLSTVDATGGIQPTGINVTTIDLGAEGVYYISGRFAIGGLVSHRRLSADAPDKNAVAKVGSSLFGPLVKVRLPIDGRSSFVAVASFGGTTIELVNQNTGLSDNKSVTGTGKYWLAGGGFSFDIAPRASFDLSLRYEDSRFGATGGGHTDGSGLIVGIGFSLYFDR